MTEYWESRFNNEGEMWGFEPSDSSITAARIFRSERLKNILVPGFGYGRNAKYFLENNFNVTGIEISESAIRLARDKGLNCIIHHGSVTSMPYDEEQFDAVFCYAMIHLLNKYERRTFLKACYSQLNKNGMMIFVVSSTDMDIYRRGRYLSKNRYEISGGLKVFFYDSESVLKEFSAFGMTECRDIEEPVKFMKNQDPLKLKFVICRKQFAD